MKTEKQKSIVQTEFESRPAGEWQSLPDMLPWVPLTKLEKTGDWVPTLANGEQVASYAEAIVKMQKQN